MTLRRRREIGSEGLMAIQNCLYLTLPRSLIYHFSSACHGAHALRVVGWSDVVEASLPRQLAAALSNWPTPARGRVLYDVSNEDTAGNLAGVTSGKH